MIHIHKKICVIDNFKAKMLLITNILNFEYININVDEKKLLVKSCKINIKIKIKNNVNI